jgi:hypothetical protein
MFLCTGYVYLLLLFGKWAMAQPPHTYLLVVADAFCSTCLLAPSSSIWVHIISYLTSLLLQCWAAEMYHLLLGGFGVPYLFTLLAYAVSPMLASISEKYLHQLK